MWRHLIILMISVPGAVANADSEHWWDDIYAEIWVLEGRQNNQLEEDPRCWVWFG